MHAIQPIQTPLTTPATPAGPTTQVAETQSFQSLLIDGLEQANSSQQTAEHAVQHISTDGNANPTEFLTAIQQADLSLQAMIQVRNQLVQAYEQLKAIDL